MSADSANDDFASRYGLGSALAALTVRDGTMASVHVHRSGGDVWLVFSYDDDGGGEASAAPGRNGVAVTLVSATLLAGGKSARDVVAVELELCDREEHVTCQPAAGGAWIAAFEHVELPTELSIVERTASGRIIREHHLDFPDGPEPQIGLARRALRWIRLRFDLPGPLALPRGTTSYPQARR